MRFVIALFLTLWLPLQAAAALASGVCADHGRAAPVGASGQSAGASSAHRHHAASTSARACDESGTQHGDSASGVAADACNHCGLCAVSAAPCVAVHEPGRDAFTATAIRVRHTPPAIAVVPPDLIYRPPISAAA